MDSGAPPLLGGVIGWSGSDVEEEPVGPGVAETEQVDDAFDALFLRMWDRMVRRAFLVVRSIESAEEVVQDAFAEVYRRWRSIERHDAYLARAVTTGAIRRAERSDRERPLRAANDRPTPSGEEAVADRVLVDALLAELNPRARMIVVLRFFDDLTESEIAEQVGCRVGTVGPTITRALRRLAEEVEQ